MRPTLRPLVLAVLLAVAACAMRSEAATLAPPTPASELATDVTPEAQQLELELDPFAAGWNGSLTSELRVHRTLSRFSLALTGPLPSRVALSDARGKVEVLWAVRDHKVLIESRRPLKPGRAVLFLSFDGDWGAPGQGLRREGDGPRTRIVAHLGGHDAERVFPCWPGDPATRWLLLVHAPKDWHVRAGTATPESREVQGRWRTTTFRMRKPVRASTLTLEVALGR